MTDMIKPLRIGRYEFAHNIIQGPLAGISAAPFRRLTWQYGKPVFSCTEMISCKTILHHDQHRLKRFLHKDPNEGPVCFQLSSNHPKELAEAVKRVTDHGADFIDLNCGCPVKKIRARGAGSYLLSRPSEIYQLITAMKNNTHVPISIKIRVDNHHDDFNQTIAQVVQDAGADFLIVHGRHWTEHYETPCNVDAIQFFVETLKHIPVIGNGDIACLASLKKMLATGCHGVMISRAGVGQPWLIAKLCAEYFGTEFALPSTKQIAAMFITHAEDLIQLLENEYFAILQMRKLAKYYARAQLWRTEFTAAINQCQNFSDFKKTVHHFFY